MDDICLGVENGQVRELDIPQSRATALGPLIELQHVRSGMFTPRQVGDAWLHSDAYDPLLANMEQGSSWFAPDTGDSGFTTVARLQRDDLAWTDFSMRAKRAAVNAGFSPDYGGKFIAAIAEFYSNVREHSQRIETGYILFAGVWLSS